MTTSILAKLQTKKQAAVSVTWSLNVQPELSTRLDKLAARMSVHRTEIIRLLVDQGIDDLNEALDEEAAKAVEEVAPQVDEVDEDATEDEVELPDLTPTPAYDEAGIATAY
jgi:predicted DNA-binding protein